MNQKTHKPEKQVKNTIKHVKTRFVEFPAKSKHTIKQFENFKKFNRMLSYTLPVLFPESPKEELDNHIKYLLHLYQSKGPEYVVRYLKATQESLECLIFNLFGDLKHEKVSLGKDRDKWPKWLGSRLKSNCLSNRDIQSIRYVLTLCSTRRLITIRTLTNLDSITQTPNACPDTIRRIAEVARKPLERYHSFFTCPEIGSQEECEAEGLITTNPMPALEVNLKSGPNGVTIFNFPWDRATILSQSLEDILKDFADIFYSGDVDKWFDEKLLPYEDLVDSNRQLSSGKLSLTFEGGKLKPRIFAMVDSFTQTLLRPFHDTLMRILKTIPMDCTFDHDKVSQHARKLHSSGHTFYGFADLSNASDSIYKGLYEKIGDCLIEGLGETWVSLFDRDFIVPTSILAHWNPSKPYKRSVRYNTGQPMGALSSWPFMALVHHCIVWKAFGSYKKSKGRYLLLGDDIVIFDKEAYSNYCQTLEKLGITYTHNVSTVGFEFAKRMFFQGHEITGAYTSALWASMNTPELFSLEWRTLATRGYSSGLDLPVVLRTLLKVSRKRFERCRLLMLIPYGTRIRVEDLAKFVLNLTGRSSCFLKRGNSDNSVEAVKCFRQGASILIKQQFQESLDNAKSAIETNARNFAEFFKAKSGLSDHSPSVMQKAIDEYIEDSKVRIRFLERDLKRSYLGSTQIVKSPTGEDKLVHIDPSDKVLLRPNLPQVPRIIDFKLKFKEDPKGKHLKVVRDNHERKLRFRAAHHLNIISLLRG